MFQVWWDYQNLQGWETKRKTYLQEEKEMTSIHTIKTAYVTGGNHSDNGCEEFLDELRRYVEKGWILKKLWYEPQYGPTENYFNAKLEKEENE
jgi:hypothetical protein